MARRGKAYFLVFCLSILVCAGLFGAFVEFRHVYGDDNIIYPLCDRGLFRNCLLLEDDSNRYIIMSETISIPELVKLFRDGGLLSLGVANNILLYFEFAFARTLVPSAPYLTVILFNACLFIGGSLNVRAIARKLHLDEADCTILYCANPLMLFAMTSNNKEIWGIFIVSLMARAFLSKRLLLLVGLTMLAFIIRFAFFALGSFLILRLVMPRIKFWHIVVALCLAIPTLLAVTQGFLSGQNAPSWSEYAGSIEQKSAPLMQVAAAALGIPFGPLMAWIIVIGVDMVSPALNVALLGQYSAGIDVDLFAYESSSVLFTILFGALMVRLYQARFRILPIAEIFLYYAIVVGTFPISAHRYLLAIWPILTLAVMHYAKEKRELPVQAQSV